MCFGSSGTAPLGATLAHPLRLLRPIRATGTHLNGHGHDARRVDLQPDSAQAAAAGGVDGRTSIRMAHGSPSRAPVWSSTSGGGEHKEHMVGYFPKVPTMTVLARKS